MGASSNNHTKLARAGSRNIKRNLRADGLSLLPSALRPYLIALAVASITSLISSLCINNTASAVSLTLTIPSAPLTVNLNPNTDNGFAKSSDSEISVSTGANWGYELSVKAKDDNTLKNSGSSTNKLESIASPIDETTFKSGADYVNKWGFKPSKANSESNDKYLAAPTSSSPLVVEKTSGSNSSATKYSVAIGAKANSTLTSGTYSNNFVFTATANSVSYSITYNLNSGSWSGTSPQSGSTTGSTVTLDSHSPTRSNYTFEGWCSTTVTNNSGTNPTCSGTKYNANGTYTLSSSTNTLNLYAMWKSTGRSYTINYKSNISGASSIPSAQSGSVSSPYNVTLKSSYPSLSGYAFLGWCTSTTSTSSCSGSTYKPGSSYTVGSNGVNITLYAMWHKISTVQNKGSLGTMQSFSCNSKLPNIHDYGTVTDSRGNTSYRVAKLADGKCWMIDNLKIVNRSISSSDSDMPSGSFTIPSSNLSTFKTDSSNINNSAAYVDSTYGGYYTWYTATAGTGSSSITSAHVNAASSICPKGWKLPTGGSSSEFKDLITAYGGGSSSIGSTNLRATPVPGFTYAGYVAYSSGSLLHQDLIGYYWSSTSINSTNAYYLELNSTNASSVSSWNRAIGYPVRCVAR